MSSDSLRYQAESLLRYVVHEHPAYRRGRLGIGFVTFNPDRLRKDLGGNYIDAYSRIIPKAYLGDGSIYPARHSDVLATVSDKGPYVVFLRPEYGSVFVEKNAVNKLGWDLSLSEQLNLF